MQTLFLVIGGYAALHAKDHWVHFALITLVLCATAFTLAKWRHRDPLVWAMLTALLSVVPAGSVAVILILAFMAPLCPKCHAKITRSQNLRGECPACHGSHEP